MRTRIVEQGNMPTSMGRAGRLRSRITSTLALPVASVAADLHDAESARFHNIRFHYE